MCGEYDVLGIVATTFPGSPPHVWRIRTTVAMQESNGGITSTCVENTRYFDNALDARRDHLHMCGEYSKQIPL